MNGEGLINLKAAALLHDPPWKPWIICGRKAFITEGKRCGSSRHECEASEFSSQVWPAALFGYTPPPWDIRVRTADKFAASMERVALNQLYKEERHQDIICSDYYVNLFDPEAKLPVRKSVSKDEVNAYVEELSGIIRELAVSGADKALAYNVLYALLEPLWYRNCRTVGSDYCVPVADTRFPNHTVFDHVQATATVMNWVHRNEIKGYLIKLDLAGIQEFLSKSRKLLDLWAGSWLVSAITWYLVADIVRWVGPDTVVSPALSFNPFYLSSLLKWLRDTKELDKIVDKVEEVVKELGYEGKPEQPMMPGTVILALPCLNENEAGEIKDEALRKALTRCDNSTWKEYFINRYRKGWSKVYAAIREEILNDINELVPNGVTKDDALRLIEKAGEEPPLLLRVVIVDVRESGREYGLGREPDPLFFHWLITEKLPETQLSNGWSSLRVTYPPKIAKEIHEYTKNNPSSGRCTICGIEPGVVKAPEKGYARTGTTYKEGEKLGPYCLIKRFVSTSPNKVAKALGMEWSLDNVTIPSNVEIANVNAIVHYLLELKRSLDIIKVDYNELLTRYRELKIPEPIRQYLRKVARISDKELVVLDSLYNISLCWSQASPVYNALVSRDSNIINEFIECVTKVIAGSDTGIKEKVKHAVENAVNSSRKIARKYYAVVKADGDNFGRVLRGYLRTDPEAYVREVLRSANLAKSMGENLVNKLIDYYASLVSTYRENGEDSYPTCYPCKDRGFKQTVVVTPTYLRAVSRAMMITAIADQRIIRDNFGVVIYAGGDDLAALVPAWIDLSDDSFITPADVVAETRRVFWGVGDNITLHGFISIGNGVYPASRAFGRTYGVVLAHIIDPFSYVWSLSTELEEIKDEVGTSSDSNCRLKDITALFYGRLGSVDPGTARKAAAIVANVAVPGSEPGKALHIVKEILRLVILRSKSGGLSRSFLYDITSEDSMKTINSVGSSRKDLMKKYIEYIMRRNIEHGLSKDNTIKRIIHIMELSRILDARIIKCTNVCSDESEERCKCEGKELASQVFLMSRYILSGKR